MVNLAVVGESILTWLGGMWRTYLTATKLERCKPGEIGPLLTEFADADTAARLATRSGSARERLLRRMMAAVGVNRSALETSAPGQLRRLQRACLWCESADQCRRDLDQHQIRGSCPEYCANATVLNQLDRRTAASWPADSRSR